MMFTRPDPKPQPRRPKEPKGLRAKRWMRKGKPRRLDPPKPIDDYYADAPLAKSRKGSDPKYLAWLHTQPCVALMLGAHGGPIEAAHHRNMTGLGRKEPDRNAIPLCRKHHQEFDQHRGDFDREADVRKAWFERHIAETRARYEAQR